jgi:hypothetical protein
MTATIEKVNWNYAIKIINEQLKVVFDRMVAENPGAEVVFGAWNPTLYEDAKDDEQALAKLALITNENLRRQISLWRAANVNEKVRNYLFRVGNIRVSGKLDIAPMSLFDAPRFESKTLELEEHAAKAETREALSLPPLKPHLIFDYYYDDDGIYTLLWKQEEVESWFDMSEFDGQA